MALDSPPTTAAKVHSQCLLTTFLKTEPVSVPVEQWNNQLSPRDIFLIQMQIVWVYMSAAVSVTRPYSDFIHTDSYLDHSPESLERLRPVERASYATRHGAEGDQPHSCIPDTRADHSRSRELCPGWNRSKGLLAVWTSENWKDEHLSYLQLACGPGNKCLEPVSFALGLR